MRVTSLVAVCKDVMTMLPLNGTGNPALRWEVARVWRLGRQINYVIVSAQ